MLRSDKGLFLLKLDIWRFKSSFNAKLSSSQPFTMYPKAGFTPNVWSSKRGSGLSLKYQQNCTSFFPLNTSKTICYLIRIGMDPVYNLFIGISQQSYVELPG